MLVITLETGGQDSSSFPQAFNYQPLNTQTIHFMFFSSVLTPHLLVEYLPLLFQALCHLRAFVTFEALAVSVGVDVQGPSGNGALG